MIRNALTATIVVILLVLFGLLHECRFLVPYRDQLIGPYARVIAGFAAALFLNLFAVFYLLFRTLFLKETGQKLAHLEKQLRSQSTISDELSERLQE